MVVSKFGISGILEFSGAFAVSFREGFGRNCLELCRRIILSRWYKFIIPCIGDVNFPGGWIHGIPATILGGGFKYFLFSPRKLGKIPTLTIIFFQRVETTNKFYFLGWFWGVVQCNEKPWQINGWVHAKMEVVGRWFSELQLGDLFLFLEFSVMNTPEI